MCVIVCHQQDEKIAMVGRQLQEEFVYRLNVLTYDSPLRERTGYPGAHWLFWEEVNSKCRVEQKLAPDLIYELYQYIGQAMWCAAEHTSPWNVWSLWVKRCDEINSRPLHEALNNATRSPLNIVATDHAPIRKPRASPRKILVQRGLWNPWLHL